jgi:hypothetical protein
MKHQRKLKHPQLKSGKKSDAAHTSMSETPVQAKFYHILPDEEETTMAEKWV